MAPQEKTFTVFSVCVIEERGIALYFQCASEVLPWQSISCASRGTQQVNVPNYAWGIKHFITLIVVRRGTYTAFSTFIYRRIQP